jgi:hypothetical protein
VIALAISGWAGFVASFAWALWPRYGDEQTGHIPVRKLPPGLEGTLAALGQAAWTYRRAAAKRRLTR